MSDLRPTSSKVLKSPNLWEGEHFRSNCYVTDRLDRTGGLFCKSRAAVMPYILNAAPTGDLGRFHDR